MSRIWERTNVCDKMSASVYTDVQCAKNDVSFMCVVISKVNMPRQDREKEGEREGEREG